MLIYASPKSTNYYILPDFLYFIEVVSVFMFWFLADVLENHRPRELLSSKKFKYVSPKNKITLSYIINVPLSHPRNLKPVYYYLINNPHTKFPACCKSVLRVGREGRGRTSHGSRTAFAGRSLYSPLL